MFFEGLDLGGREQLVAALGELAAEAGAEHDIKVGHSSNTILEYADKIGADLIVLGSRGLDPAGRYVLGSVPEKVLFDSHGHDVLVVRTAP